MLNINMTIAKQITEVQECHVSCCRHTFSDTRRTLLLQISTKEKQTRMDTIFHFNSKHTKNIPVTKKCAGQS